MSNANLLFASVFNVSDTLVSSGAILALVIIGAIVFAESGLLFGFFLPGDTLLFTAGFLASQGLFPLAAVLAVIFSAAVIGDNVGYFIGQKGGPKLFTKKDGLIFRHDYIEKAEAFYEKHGGKTIILARFTPIIRTFAPVVAGIGRMDRKLFITYNLIGGFLWTFSLVLLGYFAGGLIKPEVLEKYIVLAVAGVIVLSFGPVVYHLAKAKIGLNSRKDK